MEYDGNDEYVKQVVGQLDQLAASTSDLPIDVFRILLTYLVESGDLHTIMPKPSGLAGAQTYARSAFLASRGLPYEGSGFGGSVLLFDSNAAQMREDGIQEVPIVILAHELSHMLDYDLNFAFYPAGRLGLDEAKASVLENIARPFIPGVTTPMRFGYGAKSANDFVEAYVILLNQLWKIAE